MNKIRLIITGGSGFIGTNAVDYLISENIKFINLDFNPPKKQSHFDYWENIDICDYKKLLSCVSNFSPTHVLHLAADLGMDHKNFDNLQCNIKGVENLINVVSNNRSIRRVVFTSSLLVCRNGYIPSFDTDYCPPNLYGESKMIGEKKIRSSNLNCEWAIVRPTSIWGPWFDYSYKDFFKVIDKNRYKHIGEQEFQKPASFVGNAVFMFLKILLGNEEGINKSTYYLADYPWYSTREWATTIQKTLESKPIGTAPIWLLRVISFIGDIVKILFRFEPPLTSFRLNNMLTGGIYPIDNTKNIAGELPYDLNQAVFFTSLWMYENNLIKHKPKKHDE